jgi:histidyl-tRNA synthetase
MEKIKPVLSKGTRDFLPNEVAKRNFLFDTIKKVFLKYGFQQIETPAIERLETLTGKYGNEGDKLLFKILNSGDFLKNVPSEILNSRQSNVAVPHLSDKGLRYDLTVPLARFVVQHQDKLAFPFRRFHIGPVWRADRPQKGRYQEFYQCDADIIGSHSLINEVELILMFYEVFQNLKMSDISLNISNRKILGALAEKMNCAEKFSSLATAIDKLDKLNQQQVFEMLKQESFTEEQIGILDKFLSITGKYADTLSQLKIFFRENPLALEGISELEYIISTALDIEAQVPIEIDLSLARGLDYYTGFIVEVKDRSGKLGSSLGSGGRYDNLTEMFGGRQLTGVGISFGIERIFDAMQALQLFPETYAIDTKVLFCHFDQETFSFAFRALQHLRQHGIAAEIYPSPAKLNKQLEYANKKGISYAIIVGSDELQTQLLTVKNLSTGQQEKVPLSSIADYFCAL